MVFNHIRQKNDKNKRKTKGEKWLEECFSSLLFSVTYPKNVLSFLCRKMQHWHTTNLSDATHACTHQKTELGDHASETAENASRQKKRGGTQRSNAERYCGAPNGKYYFSLLFFSFFIIGYDGLLHRAREIYEIMKLLLLLKIGYYYFLFLWKVCYCEASLGVKPSLKKYRKKRKKDIIYAMMKPTDSYFFSLSR